MIYVVYFEKVKTRCSACIVDYSKEEKRGVSQCYLCPVKSCTEFTDGEKRVKVDAEVLEQMKNNPKIRIIKIIER